MITSTKSVKCLLGYNITGGVLTFMATLFAFVSELGKQANQNAGYVFGYSFAWMVYLAITAFWVWANAYAFHKLNLLREEATQLRTMPRSELEPSR